MKSSIDWNEIVPRLGEGLKQTLYLEAVRLMTAGRSVSADSAERKRAYAREYYRNHIEQRREYNKRYRKGMTAGVRRQFTPKQRAEVVAFAKEHSTVEAMRKYSLSSSLLSRWISGKIKVG